MDFIYNPPQSPLLPILYHDKDIVVFDKPSGLLSVRGKKPEHQDSLEARAQRVWPEVGVAHRLDMATSGILVWALHKPALSGLARQFQDRKTEKLYIAEIFGHPDADQGYVELPLICDWPNRPKQMVEFNRGKASTTYWKVLERKEKTTRVELHPITGRSHQLRVHMKSIGHSIIGDRLYSQGEALSMTNRLHLHAQQLSFHHPINKQKMDFFSPCLF
ncbi:pseudouridine synthase [Catenovulum maritimum]|uniref:Pseudouridine synthase n=1 Tax=Catenovulum maritimum TaxID=1513271 RepID=A0A0J8GWE2_9ALTE|nr:pseudouridine synthase [Catenovulum maritimum]KMT65609.1 pseudouridine synthase [Catenovulum maritimum]